MASFIDDVSDTARWIAAVRAAETARPDALFRDDLAKTLAGHRGVAIANRLPWLAAQLTEGGIVARTIVIDRLIEQCVSDGAARVVNLAAGFDTRPYRLDLPAELEWIEVDLAPLVAEKNALTGKQQPNCQLRRLSKDLADADARNETMEIIGAGRHLPTVAITEGLLAYLDRPQVQALATDLAAAGVTWWITDVYSASAMRTLQFAMNGYLDRSPVNFRAPRRRGLKFFAEHGDWHPGIVYSELASARACKRLPFVMWPLSRPPGARPARSGRGNWIAITRLAQSGRPPLQF